LILTIKPVWSPRAIEPRKIRGAKKPSNKLIASRPPQPKQTPHRVDLRARYQPDVILAYQSDGLEHVGIDNEVGINCQNAVVLSGPEPLSPNPSLMNTKLRVSFHLKYP
jgi:hypothetical protein